MCVYVCLCMRARFPPCAPLVVTRNEEVTVTYVCAQQRVKHWLRLRKICFFVVVALVQFTAIRFVRGNKLHTFHFQTGIWKSDISQIVLTYNRVAWSRFLKEQWSVRNFERVIENFANSFNRLVSAIRSCDDTDRLLQSLIVSKTINAKIIVVSICFIPRANIRQALEEPDWNDGAQISTLQLIKYHN